MIRTIITIAMLVFLIPLVFRFSIYAILFCDFLIALVLHMEVPLIQESPWLDLLLYASIVIFTVALLNGFDLIHKSIDYICTCFIGLFAYSSLTSIVGDPKKPYAFVIAIVFLLIPIILWEGKKDALMWVKDEVKHLWGGGTETTHYYEYQDMTKTFFEFGDKWMPFQILMSSFIYGTAASVIYDTVLKAPEYLVIWPCDDDIDNCIVAAIATVICFVGMVVRRKNKR